MQRYISRDPTSAWLALLFFLSGVGACLAQGAVPGAGGTQTPAAPVVNRGDAVVTGFAGLVQPGPDLPIDVHPLDRTNIDPEGATVRVFDLTRLNGGPQGQLSDAPVKFLLKAREVGHVFGAAFDSDDDATPPNVYLTATSVFGLHLMAPGAGGRMERVITGRPGAQWMSGLFGQDKGGGPGSIWKVDGRTGIVSLFADIKTGDLENSGAGLGSIAFDPRSRHLYVSDLETGLVWRLDIQGKLIDVFDHGTQGRAAAGLPFAAYDPENRTDRTAETFNTEVPETWGFAPAERRVWALAIENNRLYYSVADGPAVWSVGLNADGSFAADPRREIDVQKTPQGNQISSILFDGPNTVYLAQRGSQLGSYDYQSFMRPQESTAMRYKWNEAARRWAEAYEEYAVGLPPEHHAAVGGLALNYGYDRFGNIDYGRCRQTLWVTGEHLRAGSDIVRVARGGPEQVNGLQGIYKSRVKPDNEPPFESWYVDYDATFADAEAYGHVGNVAIYNPCAAGVTYSADRVEVPVWTRGPDLVVDKVCYPGLVGGRIRCTIFVRNKGDGPATGIIELLDETRTLWGKAVDELIPIASSEPDGDGWTCATIASGAFACRLDAGSFAAGAVRKLSVWVDTHDLVAAGNLGFRNCVTLNHPAGRGKACAEGGTDIVVEKIGPSRCTPGEDCTFTLKLTNKSQMAFDADVLLADHMLLGGAAVAASISEIEPPLGCTSEPTKLPFSCVARVTLGPGQSREHKIVVEMPDKSPVWAANCFGASDPWLVKEPKILADLLAPLKIKVKSKDLPGGHPSCVWFKIDDKKAAAPKKSEPNYVAQAWAPPLGFLPPLAVCADGRRPLPNGRCPCPLSASWDPDTNSCRAPPVCWSKARLRPDGYCCPRGTVWWPQTESCRPRPVVGCHDIWRRQPDGSCCPRGTHWRDGACRPRIVEPRPCGPGEIRIHSGLCIALPVVPPVVSWPKCPDGRPRLRNGHCPPKVCPLNAPFSRKTGRCEPVVIGGVQCKPGFVRLPGSRHCTPIGNCPARLVRNRAGHCVPPGLIDVGKGGVDCKPGQRRVAGRCITVGIPVPPPNKVVPPNLRPCPGGFVRNEGGKCVPRGFVGGGKDPNPCPRGLRRDASGKCSVGGPGRVVPPRVTLPEVKPPRVEPPRVVPPRGGKPPEVKPPRVQPPRVKPPEVKPPRVKPPRVKPPEARPPRVQPPRIKPPRVTPKPPANRVQPQRPRKPEVRVRPPPQRNSKPKPRLAPRNPRPNSRSRVAPRRTAPKVRAIRKPNGAGARQQLRSRQRR